MPYARTAIHVLLVLAVAVPAVGASDDAVTVRSAQGRSIKVHGQILEFDGVSLRLRMPSGRERSFPADKVLDVHSHYVPQHVQADAALEAGRFDKALALYRQAIDVERRRWVRRRILVQTVRCYAGLGHTVQAGEVFLQLARDRPGVADLAVMPLAWSPHRPSPELERAARAWIRLDSVPPAVLLGASHLLATDRAEALARLKGLLVEVDGPVAQLAGAQIWRAEIVSVDDRKLSAWRRAVDRMPEPIRAGPYYLLGKGLARRAKNEEAALALLRVPILYPRQRRLAADALWEAGRALEQLGRPAQAARLYRELLEIHPGARHAADARTRWKQLVQKKEDN